MSEEFSRLQREQRNKKALHDPQVRGWLLSNLPADEGRGDKVYLDPKGIPTVGNGHAMGTETNGQVQMYDLETINTDLRKAGVPEMSAEDYQQVREEVGKLNEKGSSIGEIVDANERIKTTTTYGLDEQKRRRLLEHDLDTRLDAGAKSAAREGVELMEHSVGTRRAVGDFSFNGGENKTLGPGQANTEALKNKDYGRLMFEYGVRSNAEGLSGADVRNKKAVTEIYNDLPEAEKQKAVERFNDLLAQDPEAQARWERIRTNIGAFPWEEGEPSSLFDDGGNGGRQITPQSSLEDVFADSAVAVRSYSRSDGTRVGPHRRSAPDGDESNNLSK